MTNTNLREFFEKISLAQKISALDPHIRQYAGSDIEVSNSLAVLNVALKHGILENTPEVQILTDLLTEMQKSTFASSPMTDVFTKLGLMLPKKTKVIQIGDYPE